MVSRCNKWWWRDEDSGAPMTYGFLAGVTRRAVRMRASSTRFAQRKQAATFPPSVPPNVSNARINIMPNYLHIYVFIWIFFYLFNYFCISLRNVYYSFKLNTIQLWSNQAANGDTLCRNPFQFNRIQSIVSRQNHLCLARDHTHAWKCSSNLT